MECYWVMVVNDPPRVEMAAAQVFTRTIQRMGLTANTPVAVAVSGGSDSLALTLLARQTFQRVIGITVDHRLREESTAEAERTGELLKRLGLEHHILSLDWGEGEGGGGLPPKGKIQVAAREKRYPAMLGLCHKMDIRTLMVAHHLDDQNETFLIRLAKGSGTDGLGGMYPTTVWPEFPHVNILRPLLQLRKTDLQEVCRKEGVEWIEDPSNQSNDYIRNNVRKLLQENEELVSGITGLMRTCQQTRRILKRQASKGLEKIDLHMNQNYGYLSFSLSKLLSLPPTVMKKVFQSLTLHISGTRGVIHYKSFARLHRQLLSEDRKTETLANCIIFSPDKHKDTVIIGRCLPNRAQQKEWTPITIGETIHWDGRWRITLKPLSREDKSPKYATKNEQLYVRHMKEVDWAVAQRGVRKIRATSLPDRNIRAGLPVVSTESGYVVLAPHFHVNDRSYGVDCDLIFKPLLPLIQDSDTHVC